MNKFLFTFLLGSSLLFSKMINGVALTVNDSPITLYDIESTMEKLNVSRSKAASVLIDKVLYNQLVQRYNIKADIFDVDNYIKVLAKNNNMDEYQFKSIIKQRYPDYSVFEKEVKDMVIRQKLIKDIVKGKLNIANEEDMKNFYENHKEQFSTAKDYKVIEYKSKNKASLLKILKNPLMIANDVSRQELSFDIDNISSQLKYILNTTKESTFSPIFISNKYYTTLFVKEKTGKTVLKFEDVKNKIFADIMTKREKKYLKEYFEKQKLIADIKIVR